MFNILVTSSSRKVSLIKAFEEALNKLSLPGKVYVADTNSLSASLYKTSNSFVSPRTDAKDYLSWLTNFCSDKKIKLIIPTRDEELIFFARIKDDFMNKGIFINISNQDSVEICNDKQKFYAYCQTKSIPIPKIFKDIGNVSYPCFIKARYGKGSRLTFKVLDRNQLQALLSIGQDYIIQEYIEWPEYTVDYFADFQCKPISAVPRERILIWAGESFIGKTLKDRFIIDKVMDLCTGLKLMGHNTVQLFYNREGKEVKFIEINPRFGGGVSLGIAGGANTPLFLIKLILKQPVDYSIYDFKDNLYMFRYTEDVFIKESDLKR